MPKPKITKALLKWHDQHGRTDLPWQNTQDPYKIWLSEIMLQQTQVATVIPYYQRFLESFPNIDKLAKAPTDEVLHLWTGLGYYARARNLHKAAKIVSEQYKGVFPSDFEKVLELPGIGKSTAGAILAFAKQQRHAILDGNVKRVLSRFYAVEGWYGKKAVQSELWELAELNTPSKRIAQYTQAIMDFGATLCTRSKPNCQQCPLAKHCQALQQERVHELPTPKPKTNKPVKQTYMLMIKNENGEYLLEQRPPAGIWGSLWCPIETDRNAPQIRVNNMQLNINQQLPTFRHTFSHYSLDITPLLASIKDTADVVEESTNLLWYTPSGKQALGLPAPVKKLLDDLSKET